VLPACNTKPRLHGRFRIVAPVSRPGQTQTRPCARTGPFRNRRMIVARWRLRVQYPATYETAGQDAFAETVRSSSRLLPYLKADAPVTVHGHSCEYNEFTGAGNVQALARPRAVRSSQVKARRPSLCTTTKPAAREPRSRIFVERNPFFARLEQDGSLRQTAIAFRFESISFPRCDQRKQPSTTVPKTCSSSIRTSKTNVSNPFQLAKPRHFRKEINRSLGCLPVFATSEMTRIAQKLVCPSVLRWKPTSTAPGASSQLRRRRRRCRIN
jgi:hypothetical protein